MSTFKPPTGINFHLEEFIQSDQLSNALCSILSHLQNIDPHTCLIRYEDWWEHDGFHFHKGNTTYHEVFEIIRRPQSLLENMPHDEYVRIGIAPESGIWYLRFYLAWDDTGQNLEGDFDITLPSEQAEFFHRNILSPIQLPLIEEKATTYFARIIQ